MKKEQILLLIAFTVGLSVIIFAGINIAIVGPEFVSELNKLGAIHS